MTVADERWHMPKEESPSSTTCQASETVLALARAWSRLPCPAVVTLKKIGDIQVRPDQIAMVDDFAQVQGEDMAWFKLARASEQAWLGMTLQVCHALIRAVLGGASPLLIRPLGSAERGLMAATVASALSSLGLARQVTLAWTEERPCWQGPRVLLTGAICGGTEISGRALFIGPLSWLGDGAGRSPVMTPTEESVVEGVLVLGRTMLPAADMGAAAPGDAVVFDGTPGLVLGVAWPVTLLVGRSCASGRLEPDSSLSLDGTWMQTEENAAASQDKDGRWKPTGLTSTETTNAASALVEVVAELGRISLRGDELAKLSKGAALALGPRPCRHIDLRVGGRLWATGELVTLGEQLGVRVLRLRQEVGGEQAKTSEQEGET